jgi:hypothetical protein
VTDGRCASDNTAGSADSVAASYAGYNLTLANALCAAPAVVRAQRGALTTPRANAITVIVTCRVGFAAGRVLGLLATDMGVTATAAIGNQDADGNLADYIQPPPGVTDPPLVGRLVP